MARALSFAPEFINTQRNDQERACNSANCARYPYPRANLPSEVVIGPNVLPQTETITDRYMDADRLVLADPDTWKAIGEPTLAGELLLLEAHPHADDETVQRVADALGTRSGILAIGSGTINDLAKRAAHLCERRTSLWGPPRA